MGRRYIRDAQGRFAEVPGVQAFERSVPKMGSTNYSVGSFKEKGYRVQGHPAEFKRQKDANAQAERIAAAILTQDDPKSKMELRAFRGNKEVRTDIPEDWDPTPGQMKYDPDARKVKPGSPTANRNTTGASAQEKRGIPQDLKRTTRLDLEEGSIRQELEEMGSGYKVRDLQRGGGLFDRVERAARDRDGGITIKIPSGSELRISKDLTDELLQIKSSSAQSESAGAARATRQDKRVAKQQADLGLTPRPKLVNPDKPQTASDADKAEARKAAKRERARKRRAAAKNG